jgi:hypothetical protein
MALQFATVIEVVDTLESMSKGEFEVFQQPKYINPLGTDVPYGPVSIPAFATTAQPRARISLRRIARADLSFSHPPQEGSGRG